MTGWIVAAIVFIVAGIIIWRLKKDAEHPAAQRTATAQPPRQRVRTVPASQKSETGPMVYYANDRHGRRDKEYRFNYKKVNGSWRGIYTAYAESWKQISRWTFNSSSMGWK